MPSIGEFRIQGYRSFSSEQILHFAVPKIEQNGSGLTWIVGPNNAGKSALLEGIDLCSRGHEISLDRIYRNKSTLFQTKMSIAWTDGRNICLESNPVNPLQLVSKNLTSDKKPTPTHRPIYIPSVPRIPTSIETNPPKGIEVLLNYSADPHARQERPSFLTQRLRKWLESGTRALEMFREIVDVDIKFYPEGGRLNVEVFGNEHPPEGLGSGIATIAHIVDAIYELPQDSTIMIDEPERRLHPSYQRRLLRVLTREASRLQIIICTHSPFLIDWNALQAGAHLIRLSRAGNAYSQIHQLSAETIKGIAPLIKDLFNPHVFGINATEFLFLPDAIVLVEGQEDVVYLQRGLEQHGLKMDADFYGWGVGGAEKMNQISQVLFELGFRNVVGLLDRDKQSLAVDLAAKFPGYRFIVLPTDDIRDKPSVEKPAKTGLFRRDGSLATRDVEVLRKIHTAIESAIKVESKAGEPIIVG